MKKILLTAIAGVLSATTAAATDWSGPYAGGMVGLNSGDFAYEFGTGGDDIEGQTFGAFAGYNVQTGSFVFGGELAYAVGSVHGVQPQNESAEYTDALDLKARAGYSAGSALVYGFAGYSSGTWDNYGNTTTSADGNNYGVGVDLMISDSMFVGVEYITRDMRSDLGNGNAAIGTFSTINIRAGIEF